MTLDELRECQLAIKELVEKEDFENALPVIYSCLEEYPDDAATLHFMGYCLLVSGQEALAYQYFRRALQEQPGNHAIWCSMGRAYHELGMYEEGLKCFLKSAEIKHDYALAYANASATLIQLSRWDDAEKAAKLAIDCDPNEINSHRNLAHSYLAKGEWVKGWEAYGKSLNSKFRKEWVYGEENRWKRLS